MNVFEKLKDIISEELDVDVEDIELSSVIREDFDADSLALVDMVMSIEDEFEIEVPDEALESFITVEDAVKYIEDRIN